MRAGSGQAPRPLGAAESAYAASEAYATKWIYLRRSGLVDQDSLTLLNEVLGRQRLHRPADFSFVYLENALRRFRFSRLAEADRVKLWPDLGAVGEDVRLTGFPDFGSEPFLIRLGSHITISANVAFVNHDGGVRVFRNERPGLHVYNKITVGDHVFIGMGTIILPGVTIGDNCVIGAGSVVSRDIPPGSVAVGAPCRVIKSIHEYLTSAEQKGIDWQVGNYGDEWRKMLIANYW